MTVNSNLSKGLYGRLSEIEAVPETEWRRVLPMLKTRIIEKGDYLVRAGDKKNTFGYIVSGYLRYFYIDREGKEFTRYFCTAGNFVSPPVGKTGSEYFIQAIIKTEFLTVTAEQLAELSKANPYWNRIILAIQDYALGLSERRERSLILDDAKTRYLNLLDEFPGIENHVKQYDIANYLGITPVALSRIRSSKMR